MKTRADPHPQTRRLADDEGVRRRILIVDDHAVFRAAARELLELAGFHVVAEAADAAQALVLSDQLRPEVVLLDIQLPDSDGFTVASRLSELRDPPAVVLTSSHDSGAYRRRVATSTALGFLPKAELSGAAIAALIG